MSGRGPKEEFLPLVSVIVPTYKRINSLMRTLNSLVRSNYNNIEIIVVDMGNNLEEIQKRISSEIKNRDTNIILTNSPADLYVSGAIEKGLKSANGEFVLICADDVVVEEDTIYTLVKVMLSHPKIGVLAPLCYYLSDKDKLWWGGTKFGVTGRTYVYGKDLEVPSNIIFESDAFTTIALIRREVFLESLKNDGFIYVNPKEFPIHMEEADFCLRAKKRGWQVCVTRLARAYHDIQPPSGRALSRAFHITSPMRAYYVMRNRIIFVRKHGNIPQRILFFSVFIWVLVGVYLLAILLSEESINTKIKMALSLLHGVFIGVIYRFAE